MGIRPPPQVKGPLGPAPSTIGLTAVVVVAGLGVRGSWLAR